jgi:hypothetical protein
MMIEIAVFDSHTGETLARRFTRSPVQIGRDPSADLCITHACVSNHHAQVSFTDERAELVDLGSTNGTPLCWSAAAAAAPAGDPRGGDRHHWPDRAADPALHGDG